MEQIKGYEGLYEIHLVGTDDGQPGVWSSVRKNGYLNTVVTNKGYLGVRLNKDKTKKFYYIHRLVAEHFINDDKDLPQVDHIDNDKQNNKIQNLRWVSNSANMVNKPCKGYTWDKSKGKWQSQISCKNKHYNLGRFDTEQEAKDAYDEAKKKYYPELYL